MHFLPVFEVMSDSLTTIYRDVSAGATGATQVAPKFWDKVHIFWEGHIQTMMKSVFHIFSFILLAVKIFWKIKKRVSYKTIQRYCRCNCYWNVKISETKKSRNVIFRQANKALPIISFFRSILDKVFKCMLILQLTSFQNKFFFWVK